MDRAAVESAFQISPAVSGSLDWSGDNTVRFKAARDLKRDTQYQVTVGSEAKASDGQSLEDDYRFRFRTVGYLEVAQTVPTAGAADVEADGQITVVFNRPVVPLTAVSDPAFGELPQPLILEPAVPGTGEWINTSIYVFTPDQPLAGGTTYSAAIEPGLTDTTGGVLAGAYEWSFATKPPTVTWVWPADDGDLISVEPAVSVQFDIAVDPASAEQAFVLSGGGVAVDGDVEVAGNTLTFTPAEQLSFDTLYVARVEAGVQSTAGGEGMRSPYEWTFTTVPLPQIVRTSPYDGQDDADPYMAFEIVFNAPIDPGSVMPNISMTPPISPARVFTYFRSYDNAFVFDFGAQPSTDYEVRIGPDIADPCGNTIGEGASGDPWWSTIRFRTAALDPFVRLDVPGMIGTYDAYQPPQMFVGHLNVSRVDLALYRIGLEEFFYAQEDWWDYNPIGAPLRSWSIDVEAPLNEQRHARVDLVEGGGLLEPDVYMLEVSAPNVEYERWRQRKLLVVSESNLTLKTGRDEMLVWATDLGTGLPVADLRLTARPTGYESVGTGTTNADGVARLRLDTFGGEPLYVVSEEPFALGGTGWEWQEGISPWDFGLVGGFDEREYRAHVTTDRPIYRAGQTVYFRAVLRADDDVRYSLFTELAGTEVRVYDAQGQQIYEETLLFDEFGAVHGQLTLDPGAPLGEYHIEGSIASDRPTYHATFTVAAYRAPEFQVVVAPEDEEVVSARATRADVDVSYFFGGPVADVNVEWRVLSAPYRFEPAQFGRYDFTDNDDPWVCRWCWWYEPSQPEPILTGSGSTDAQGHLTINIPTEVMTGAQSLTIEATAYGRDGQAISGRSDVVVHQGDFYVGLAPERYLGEAGDELPLDVVTVDWAGRRSPDKTLDVEVYRRQWINVFVQNDRGGGRWEWETEDTLVHTDTIVTTENAEGRITFVPEAGGSYRVIASGRDAGERLVRSSTWVWVSDAQDVSWRRENDDRFDLISDKATYLPGETAEILIPSPFQGEQWAWITVERGGVLRQEVLRQESNSEVYQLPIGAQYAPNVYVSAVIVKGPDPSTQTAAHKVGYVALNVEPVEQTLDITLTRSTEQAEPGDTVSFAVQARDAAGQPVRAAFSVDLVDKAVLSLKPRQEAAIVDAFYGPRGLGVSTSSGLVLSINRIMLEQLEDLEEIAARGLGIGGGGAVAAAPEEAMEMPAMDAEGARKAAEGLPADIEVREEFQDTAFWNANVVTDANGQGSVDIELPDNLTTWVCRAVGVTMQTEVGEATTELLVTKPLLVRPATPRFLVVGDRAQLSALVSNNTGSEQDVEVTLQAEGLRIIESVESDLDGAATQSVLIPHGTEAAVNWWVEVHDVPHVEVKMGAIAGDYVDVARPRLTTGPDGTLVVHRYTAPEIVGTGGQLTAEDARTEAIALPPRYDDRQGELSVQLDPSLAAGMVDGLDYLEHYPYECTEQIVSRFLPNVLTYRALKELSLDELEGPLSRPELEAKLPGLVSEGLKKLYQRQRADGGWGWWENDEAESNAHLTAYVAFAMVKARQAGFEVRQDVIERGVAYLSGKLLPARQLNSYREANQQAFILYVMAEAGQVADASEFTGSLYENRSRLSHYGRAFLALTLDLIDAQDPRIDTLLSDLQNAAIISATGTHWEEEDYDFLAMNTDTRSTAVILDAWARLDPQNELIPNVVRWLMVARRDGIWETTYETAWALMGLTDWMRVTGELRGDYDYAVWLNEELLEGGQVTPGTVSEPIRLEVAVAELLAQTSNRLTIGRGPGPGRLYYTAHLKVYLPVEEIEPLNRGVIVSRRYSDPACDAGLQCPEVTEVAQGDLVQVRLTIVAPHDLYYVVVEDPLPAGAEAIDPSLATTSLVEQRPTLLRETESEYGREFYRWWWSWYSRSEIRDDRVVLFADYLPAGTYEYTYTFRATRPGEYQVIPTHAREFYFPEVFGRGSGRLFTIQ
jgi:hypothetical protein